MMTWSKIGLRGGGRLWLRISREESSRVLVVSCGLSFDFIGDYLLVFMYVFMLLVDVIHVLKFYCVTLSLPPWHCLIASLAPGNFLFIYFLGMCFGLLSLVESRVSLEAASLSLGIEVRFAYIPPSPDPTSSLPLCDLLAWLFLL
ncbi:hypothetical protein Hanom_Chr10g00926881 [Helianthus anomalus]